MGECKVFFFSDVEFINVDFEVFGIGYNVGFYVVFYFIIEVINLFYDLEFIWDKCINFIEF